jgi:hypothetical protein
LLAGHHLPIAQFGWILAVVVELGGGLAIVFGLITRPVGLVLAIWCVATALIAHTNFADRNQEIKHGDDGRVSLRRGVRCPRLESRRMVVAPQRRSGAVGVANRNHRRPGSQSSDSRAQIDCNGSEALARRGRIGHACSFAGLDCRHYAIAGQARGRGRTEWEKPSG